jgi:hypothetical protein
VTAFYAHAGLVGAAFGLAAAGGAVARFARTRRGWLTGHRRLGLGGAGATWLGAAFAVAMVAGAGGGHLSSPHTWLGLATLVSALLTPVLGQASFRIRGKAALLRTIHRWSGRTTLVLMAVTLATGLIAAGIV